MREMTKVSERGNDNRAVHEGFKVTLIKTLVRISSDKPDF